MKQLQASLPGLISAIQAAEHGSFTAAAKQLDLTPAAVSKNVAALEAILKIRLFNRTTRQLSLTEEGRRFIHKTREGIAALDLATSDLQQAHKAQGLVRLSMASSFGRRYVLPLLPAFCQRYPDIQLDLSLNDNTVDLVREGFDIGIRGGAQPPEGMVSRKICTMSAIYVASPHYLKTHGTPTHFNQLSQHRLLRLKYLSGHYAPWLVKDSGKIIALNLPAHLSMSDPEALYYAALSHIGITRISRHHAYDALKKAELIELLSKQTAPGDASMALFYPHRVGQAPRVRAVVDFLMEAFAKEPRFAN
jgi:DNA-binding transcriptional LysR family regulator